MSFRDKNIYMKIQRTVSCKWVKPCFLHQISLLLPFSSLDFLPAINTLYWPMNQTFATIFQILFFLALLWKQWSLGHLFPPGSTAGCSTLPADNTCVRLAGASWRWGGHLFCIGCRLLLNSLTLCHPLLPAPWWVVAGQGSLSRSADKRWKIAGTFQPSFPSLNLWHPALVTEISPQISPQRSRRCYQRPRPLCVTNLRKRLLFGNCVSYTSESTKSRTLSFPHWILLCQDVLQKHFPPQGTNKS